MKNGMTQNQQMNFLVRCKAIFVILLFREYDRQRGRFMETFHPTPLSTLSYVVCVTIIYIVHSWINSLGIRAASLSAF